MLINMAFPLLVFLMLSGFGASIGNWTENVCKNLKTKHNHLTKTEEATNFKVRISNALCKNLPSLRITEAKLSTTEDQKLSFLQDITDYFGIGDILYFNAGKDFKCILLKSAKKQFSPRKITFHCCQVFLAG